MQIIKRLIHYLWGDLSTEELKKFTFLALGFFFLIGSFWPLKTLKDSIFINTVGAIHLPLAKLYSLLCFFPLVMGYSYLVDLVSKEKLIYIFSTGAALIGFVFSYFLIDPIIGLSNPVVDPNRLIGWFFYCFIECYISLILSTYWSFVNDITPPESAKKGYGLIIFGTQLGGLIFISIANLLSRNHNLYAQRAPYISFVCFFLFFGVAAVVYILTHYVGKSELTGYTIAEEKQSPISINKNPYLKIKFIDGLFVLLTRPYVMGIFIMVWLQEIVGTIMSYQIYLQLEKVHQNAGMRNAFLFDFSLSIQLIACLFAFFGTSVFQRNFGIKACLMGYPLMIAALTSIYFLYPSLYVISSILILSKALNYAFNQPTKEILYIPTSHDTKYKSKAWIDMFGLRFGKMTGAFVNTFATTHGSIIGGLIFSLLALWSIIAHAIGTKFNKITVENKIID